jgi:hypothetical protein
MGYLGEYDFNKEYGGKEKSGKDYFGGREARQFEYSFGEKTKNEAGGDKSVNREHSPASFTGADAETPSYLGGDKYTKELADMSESVKDLGVRTGVHRLNWEEVQKEVVKAVMKRLLKEAAKMAGVPAAPLLFVQILFKPRKGPQHGEDMVPPPPERRDPTAPGRLP